MRALLKLEARVSLEERRIERELRVHRAAAAKIVGDITARIEAGPPAHELLTLARALEASACAQRVAAGALLRLANVRVERARAAVVEGEAAGDEVPDVH